MLLHSIEKGLALPQPKPWFGEKKIRDILATYDKYQGRNDSKSWITPYTIGVLKSYLAAQNENVLHNHDLESQIELFIDRHASTCEAIPIGGTKLLNIGQLSWIDERATQFLLSRSSVRQFSSEAIDDETIMRCIKVAQSSPSVCNRQTGRVHVFDRQSPLTQSILKCQGGNTGFGLDAAKVLIVTSDLSGFLSIGERNQPWIDGGLFAMTLLFALHAESLGACCLNWAKTAKEDQALRSVVELPDNESIIMLIAVGHLPKSISVAYSQRRPTSEIVTFHEPGKRRPAP